MKATAVERKGRKKEQRFLLPMRKRLRIVAQMKTKIQIISIPGAGWFVLCGNKSSKCYKTHAAAKRARTIGTKLY